MAIFVNRLRYYYAFLFIYIVLQLLFLGVLRRFNQDAHFNGLKVLELYKTFAVRLNEGAVIDSSGTYKILSLKKLSDETIYFNLSLISQCSANHLFLLEDLFKFWNGPISVAVYSEAQDVEETIWDMARIAYCNPSKLLVLHLVVPSQDSYIKNFQYGSDKVATLDKSTSCSLPQVTKGRSNYNWTSPYPINLLRNVAKRGSSTSHILVIDIDMMPSVNLRRDFLKFAGLYDNYDKNEVFVVPVFEITEDAPVPKTKVGLMKSVKLNQARPFYLAPCRNCQKLTKYSEWLLAKPTPGTRVLYEVEWKHPWEPFFIAKRDIPDFDERFKQYGMNRISQICELHVAGYKFLVLDNIFLLHKGYKTREGFHPTKEKEMEYNRRLYAKFKIELRYKYQKSSRSC